MKQSQRTVVIKRAPSLLMLLGLMLAMLLTAAVPTLAQEGNTKDGPPLAQGETPKGDTVVHIDCAPRYELVKGDDPSGKEDKCVPQSPEPPGPPSSVEETDLVAQLTIECDENAGDIAGYQLVTTGVESRTAVPLTDQDGDGVLTGTQTFPRFPPGPQPPPGSGIEPITVPDVRIVAPDGSTVKQFGPVKLDQDEIILPATISFCNNGGGSDGNSNNGGSSNGGGSAAGGGKTLPATGGALPIAGLLGALLVGGGLLARRIAR